MESGNVNVFFCFKLLEESSLDSDMAHPGFFLGKSCMCSSFSAARSFTESFSFLALDVSRAGSTNALNRNGGNDTMTGKASDVGLGNGFFNVIQLCRIKSNTLRAYLQHLAGESTLYI